MLNVTNKMFFVYQVTYDLVRGEVVSLLSMASEAMNNRLQMLDSLITDAADGAKFMESLPQEKVR